MPRLMLVVLVLLAHPAWSQAWEESIEETHIVDLPERTGGTRHGSRVAVFDGVIAVGTEKDDELAENAGAVTMFRYDPAGDVWSEEQKLTASDGNSWDLFGLSIGLWGNVLVAGAPQQEDSHLDTMSGAAYVFRYDAKDGEWIEEQKLKASDGEETDLFGRAVAVFDDLIVVGSIADDDNGSASGSGYIFRFDAEEEEWIEEQKVTASDGAENDGFGRSVAVSDDLAVFGVFRLEQDSVPDTCGAYVFRYDPDDEEWFEEQKLAYSEGLSLSGTYKMGNNVAVSGDVLALGAHFDGEENAGATFIYRYDPDDQEWIEEQKLTASDGAAYDQFGFSIAIRDELLVVGAHTDDGGGESAGSAYFYRHDADEGDWLEEEKLVASDADAYAHFGAAVAVSEDRIAVGTPSLSAYAFQLPLPFRRGDVDGNGTVDAMIDAVYLFNWTFIAGSRPVCMDAADVDDSGSVHGLLDGILLLNYGFHGGAEPPAPGPDDCGLDPSGDTISCSIQPGDCE